MTQVMEHMGIKGTVTVEVFAPQGDDVDRPLELVRLVDELVIAEAPAVQHLSRMARRAFDRELVLLEAELAACLVSREIVENLVTQVGDQCYGDAFAALNANFTVTAPAGVTGMRLGSGGATVASKTGAGAAIVTYKTGSNKAIDALFPTSTLSGSSRRETWKTSWGAGVVNGTALNEVVITNETPLTNVAGTAANTISRAIIGPYTLDALATIVLTWTHDLLGV